MYNVTAQVLNTFYTEASEKYDESFKVQLLGDNPLKDGQIKKEMLTLSVPEKIYNSLKDQIGKTVSLPVGFFVSNNRLTPFYPKNSQV
jgi:spore coat polysaccharide biosynthesis protein SpsF (cytidylyltransferase family)